MVNWIATPAMITGSACGFLTIAGGIAWRGHHTSRPRTFDDAQQRDARGIRRRVPPHSAAATAIGATWVVGGLFPALVATGLLVLWSRVRPLLAARRQRAVVERALPDAFDHLVLAVRAGLTPQQAVRELAETAPEPVRAAFALVVHRCDRGLPFAEAIHALPEVVGPRAHPLADVMTTSDRYGLALGPVLDQLSVEAREARRRIDQAESRKLPVRLSFPLVICTLPSFVLLAIAPAVIAALSSLGGSAW